MKSRFHIAAFVAVAAICSLAQAGKVQVPVEAPNAAGIITPSVATGYIRAIQVKNFPNGEMAVCVRPESVLTECDTRNAKTPAQLIKSMYPNADYVGFLAAFNGLQLYYKIRVVEDNAPVATTEQPRTVNAKKH